MEEKYTPKVFNKGYKFLLFLFMAFTIYCCMRYLFLSFQIPENHWIRFDNLYKTYLALSIFLNLYPLAAGSMLKNGKQMIDGKDDGLKFNEESRRFGGGVITFSIIIYLVIFASIVIRVIEN